MLLVACGASPGGTGSPRGPAPDPSVLLPRLADPAFVYRDLGFFAKGEPLPFVASLRYLAGPVPDSTLAVFSLSLANRALSFRRTASAVEGRYRVEVAFRRGASIIRQLSSEQAVRVGTMGEARRADESVIFQHFSDVAPGAYTLLVVGAALEPDHEFWWDALERVFFSGRLLPDQLKFEWTGGPDNGKYAIRVFGPGVRWSQEDLVNKPLAYPSSAPKHGFHSQSTCRRQSESRST